MTLICSSTTGTRLAKLLCSRTSRVSSFNLVSITACCLSSFAQLYWRLAGRVDDTKQAQTTRDNSDQNCVTHILPPFLLAGVFFPASRISVRGIHISVNQTAVQLVVVAHDVTLVVSVMSACWLSPHGVARRGSGQSECREREVRQASNLLGKCAPVLPCRAVGRLHRSHRR